MEGKRRQIKPLILLLLGKPFHDDQPIKQGEQKTGASGEVSKEKEMMISEPGQPEQNSSPNVAFSGKVA